MTELLSSISEKGQVTIPLEIRRALDLKPGGKVAFKIEDGQIKIVAATSSIEASYQAIPKLRRSLSDDEITEMAADEHAHHAAAEGG